MSQTVLSQPATPPVILPREQWYEAVRRRRDAYELTPGAPLYRCEFWLMPGAIERWKKEGMSADANWNQLFNFDEPAVASFDNLGWCEAPFYPAFEDKLIEDRSV